MLHQLQRNRFLLLALVLHSLAGWDCQHGANADVIETESETASIRGESESPAAAPAPPPPAPPHTHPRVHLHAMLRKISGSVTLASEEAAMEQCADSPGYVESMPDSEGGGEGGAEECEACESEAHCCGGCACWHGVCSAAEDACLCEADWFGDSCSFHALSHAFFLPRTDPRLRTARRAKQAAHFTAGCGKLVQDLDALQHKPEEGGEEEAEEERMMVVLMEGRGLGSWVHHMAGALTRGITEKQRVVLRYPYDYFLHEGCPPRSPPALELEDASCYMEPFASGVPPSSAARAAASRGHHKLADFWPDYAPPPNYFIHSPETEEPRSSEEPPAKSEGVRPGHMWWNVQLVSYVFAPNRRVTAALRRYKAVLNWPPPGTPILGVHVRHGDACAGWRKGVMHHSELMGNAFCLDFARDLLPAIDIMLHRYGHSHVFVSTDDPLVLQQLSSSSPPALASGREVTWVGGGAVRTFLQSDTNYDIGMRLGVLDRRMAAESAILDALLLAEASAFLGQLSGEFSRLALELSLARNGFLVPFLSLDSYPWAPRYGLAARKGWWKGPRASLEGLVAARRNVSEAQVHAELYDPH